MRTTAEAPTEFNGGKVISATYTPADTGTREGWVVLVHKPHGINHEYVTAWAGHGDDQWCWGHYFELPAEAVKDYDSRVRRGF